jgi:hypothetical protein
MKYINRIKDWKLLFRFARIGGSWSDVIERQQKLINDGFGSRKALLRLTTAVSKSEIAHQVFGCMTMLDLLVSDTADFRGINGVVLVRYREDSQRFLIYHIAIDGEQECWACPESEAWQMLVMIISRKLLIRTEPARHEACQPPAWFGVLTK